MRGSSRKSYIDRAYYLYMSELEIWNVVIEIT